jgi:2-polyprenyl-6-methoxyphenol hydroxylase-like FAD-dependent oxidoreductase
MTYDRAVVLGGSIAGLTAAAALARFFDEVLIVDRDELFVDDERGPLPRRGVPQGEQVHHLLSVGKQHIEELVPGVQDDLLAHGARQYDEGAVFAQFLRGTWRVRATSGLLITCFQRPVFEWIIRRRVLGLPNVTAVKGLATGLTSADGVHVDGAVVRGVEGGHLKADFVVDASGRGSRSPHWVEGLGYERPEEAHLNVYMGYTTFDVELADDALPAGVDGVTFGASPAFPRGAAIRPIDNGRHIIVCNGMMREYPPSDLDSMREYLARLPMPVFSRALEKATVRSELRTYQMPGNQRRYWERLRRRPERFVALGDAVASFNPLFGQGMSTAAVGGTTLVRVLAQSERAADLDGVAEKVQTGIVPWVDIAFSTAVGVDAGYEGAEFVNVDPPTPAAADRARALWELQTEDVHVMIAARRSALEMNPSILASEDVQAKVSEWLDQGRAPDPRMTDPTRIPEIVR